MTGTDMTAGPFPCCVMPSFIQDDDGFLDNLKDELLRLKYHEKDNDLYQFHQVCLSICICVRMTCLCSCVCVCVLGRGVVAHALLSEQHLYTVK